MAAGHAELWNIPGGDIAGAAERSALLDRYCTEIGRDPAAIIRSIHPHVSYDQPGTTRDAISEALDAGFRHITLGLPAEPWPANSMPPTAACGWYRRLQSCPMDEEPPVRSAEKTFIQNGRWFLLNLAPDSGSKAVTTWAGASQGPGQRGNAGTPGRHVRLAA